MGVAKLKTPNCERNDCETEETGEMKQMPSRWMRASNMHSGYSHTILKISFIPKELISRQVCMEKNPISHCAHNKSCE